MTALGLAAMLAAPVLAQQGEKPPIDINAVQPGAAVAQPATPAPDRAASSADAPAGVSTASPTAADGDKYAVSRFILTYQAADRTDLPPIEQLYQSSTALGVTPQGYVGALRGREGIPTTTVTIGDVADPAGGDFYRSAINDLSRAIVDTLGRKYGLAGVFVQLHPEDVDETNGADLREGRKEMRLIIWTGTIANVQTLASGDRLERRIASGELSRISPDDAVHQRILRQSPLEPDGLLRKDELDAFLFRLNRHPGRRVDVAVAPGDQAGQVNLDYLVAEARPWSVYAQLSNTGTASTNRWRERFGFVHNQLTKHDDILRVDYITGGFSEAHSVSLNYDFPIISDKLRLRLFGTYSTFDASNVGLNEEEFTGTTWSGGAEVAGLLYQHRELFIDGVVGARLSNIQVERTAPVFSEGNENFAIPYVGVRVDRTSEASAIFGALTFEYQIPELAGTDEDEVSNLGRRDTDAEWPMLKFSFEASTYLEPLFNPLGYSGETMSGPLTLAHEFAVSIRGQYAFGQRVIPNEEEVAGGFYSVRGYPESAVAGDSVVIGSLEYRFHLPRILPTAEPGRWRWWGEPEQPGRPFGWFGDDFRVAPQQAFGRPDWDLIFRAFVDGAVVRISNPRPVGEENETLLGAGVGVEYQFKRNVSARLDFGIPLDETKDEVTQPGDGRLHFSMTLLY